jgi:tRNA A58 N-methylase Trm61
LSEGYTYIEYGAGKGRLSHEVSEQLEGKGRILLLERESMKFKFDAHHRKEAFKRVKIDIAHFDLNRISEIYNDKKVT